MNPEDYETWIHGGVCPTLNAFDNATETRATVLFTQNQRGEVRDLRGVAGSLQAEPGAHQTNYLTTYAFKPGQSEAAGGPFITEDVVPTLQAQGNGSTQVPAVTVPQTITAPTLTASKDPSRSPQSAEVTAQVEAINRAAGGVRRLTPLECERLMGLPDNWTAGHADSVRYRQCGNAVVVPVAEWIGYLLGENV